jgi:opacity protein-like surface antigen
MILRKIFFLFFILFISFSLAQRRKKVDTVYVYENVVVYDTIYLMKPVHFKFNDLIFQSPKIEEKFFVRNIFKEELEKQRAKNRIRRQKINTFEYGIEAGIGLKYSDWAKAVSSDKPQFGENLGIWISKNILPRTSILFSANVYHWNSTIDIDANKDDSILNGFYFTEDHLPLLFQRFNNKHFDYTLQLKLLYEWKNLRPFAGILVNHNTYKMQFLVPENNVLTKMDDFKSTQTCFGFSFGLQYRFFRNFLLSLEYQQYDMKNISLKNSSFDFDIFQTNNTFVERKINFGISYIISGR